MSKTPLDELLTKHKGQWIGIRWILNNGEPEQIYGQLVDFNESFIKVKGLTNHEINRASCQIVEIITRVKE